MIRFPERFHASRTPGAARIAADHYLPDPQEEMRREYQKYYQRERSAGKQVVSEKRFDFSALLWALGP